MLSDIAEAGVVLFLNHRFFPSFLWWSGVVVAFASGAGEWFGCAWYPLVSAMSTSNAFNHEYDNDYW